MDSKLLIEKIKENLEQVAAMPHVAAKALELLNENDVSASDLSKVFELDMVLTAKLLKIVNSAYYGFPRKISTVRQAITILGNDNLKSILISTIAFELFNKNTNSNINLEGLWLHSLGTATFAQTVAEKMKLYKPEEYYIAGLLHDIGKVILDLVINREYKEVLETVKNNRMTLYDAEEQILGLNHAQAGYIVALHWKLPKTLISSIKFHHNVSESPDEASLKIAAIVQFSDFFCNIQHIGDSCNLKVALIQKKTKSVITLSNEERKNVIKKVKEDIQHAKSFFELG